MGRLSERRNTRIAFDGKIVVFVEGETDEPILLRLFDKASLADISFTHDPDGDVVKNVETSMGREEVEGEVCFGIVDRDTLNKREEHLKLFLEPDDGKFQAARPFHPRVRMLLRWEIENYLILDPKAVGCELDDLISPKKVPAWDRARVLRRLITLGDSQVPMIAACSVSVANGAGHVFGKNGIERWSRDVESRAGIEVKVDKAGHEWRSYAPDVERMHAAEESDAGLRWRAMNRLVDGKRILSQLCDSAGKERDKFRARLASRQKNTRVVEELLEILEGFRREAIRMGREKV